MTFKIDQCGYKRQHPPMDSTKKSDLRESLVKNPTLADQTSRIEQAGISCINPPLMDVDEPAESPYKKVAPRSPLKNKPSLSSRVSHLDQNQDELSCISLPHTMDVDEPDQSSPKRVTPKSPSSNKTYSRLSNINFPSFQQRILNFDQERVEISSSEPKSQGVARRLFDEDQQHPELSSSEFEGQGAVRSLFGNRPHTAPDRSVAERQAQKARNDITFNFTPSKSIDPKSKWRYKSQDSIKDIFNKNAIKIDQTKSFQWEELTIPIKEYIIGGAHAVVAPIPQGIRPLKPGVDNRNMIMKTFRADSILITNNDEIAIWDGASQNILAQYDQLQDTVIRTPKLYNREKVKEGCGFFLWEKMVSDFTKLWFENPNKYIDTFSEYFKIAAESGIDLDLRPSNFMLNDAGEIVLIDFLESTPHKGHFLRMELENRIKTFCQNKNDPKADPIYQILILTLESLPK